jgi:hypothetical protein
MELLYQNQRKWQPYTIVFSYPSGLFDVPKA